MSHILKEELWNTSRQSVINRICTVKCYYSLFYLLAEFYGVLEIIPLRLRAYSERHSFAVILIFKTLKLFIHCQNILFQLLSKELKKKVNSTHAQKL